jgi:hypothetical protein
VIKNVFIFESIEQAYDFPFELYSNISVKVAYFMIKEIGFLQKLTKRTPLLDINYIVKVPVCFTWINSIIEMEFMYPVLIKHCYHGHPVNFNFNDCFFQIKLLALFSYFHHKLRLVLTLNWFKVVIRVYYKTKSTLKLYIVLIPS